MSIPVRAAASLLRSFRFPAQKTNVLGGAASMQSAFLDYLTRETIISVSAVALRSLFIYIDIDTRFYYIIEYTAKEVFYGHLKARNKKAHCKCPGA